MTTNLPQKNHATGLEEKRRESLLVVMSNKTTSLLASLANMRLAEDRPTLTRRRQTHLDGVMAAWATVSAWTATMHDRAEQYRKGGEQRAEQEYLAVLDFEFARLSARLPSFSPSRTRRNAVCADYFALVGALDQPTHQTPILAKVNA